MDVKLGTFSKRVLLTGAGFSKNWGGLLATEFWFHLLGAPHLRGNESIRSLLLDNFNFEDVYEIVQNGDYSNVDKQAMKEATGDVLIHQEDLLNRSIVNSGTVEAMRQFLGFFQRNPFEEREFETSYIFTLNFDLLIEKFSTYWSPALDLPGVSPFAGWPQSDHPYGAFTLQTVAGLASRPPDNWPPELVGKHNYIKLHGSFGWGFETETDATDRFVIGTQKKNIIGRHAILDWYGQVFKAACCSGDVRLFVSGYSFTDVHINQSIIEGIKTSGLRIWIHNPTPPETLAIHLHTRVPDGTTIWNGLMGYSTSPLFDIMTTLDWRQGEGDRIKREYCL
jgi:hypothetical protein